jgi:hypothetical protein
VLEPSDAESGAVDADLADADGAETDEAQGDAPPDGEAEGQGAAPDVLWLKPELLQ